MENPAPLVNVDGDLVGYYDRDTRTVEWLVDEPDDVDTIIAPADVDLREALNVSGPAATVRRTPRGPVEITLDGVTEPLDVWRPADREADLLEGIDAVEAAPENPAIPDGMMLVPRPPDGSRLVVLPGDKPYMVFEAIEFSRMVEKLSTLPGVREYVRRRMKAWLSK